MNLPPLPDLSPDWTPYWRSVVYKLMLAYGEACAAAALEEAAKRFDVQDQIHGEIEDWNREVAAAIRAMKVNT